MTETLNDSGEFEQRPNREKEKKYLPLFPESLDTFRETALPIEQFYLSHPDETFSLRLREVCLGKDTFRYEATLKDSGEVTNEGLDRLEINVDITPETYALYRNVNETPMIHKFRAEPSKHIALDFFEDGHVQAEAEDPVAWMAFCDRYGFSRSFVDISGDRLADNEFRAHINYRRQNRGREALVPRPDLDIDEIVRNIWRQHQHTRQTIVTIAGRSGSGKTTLISELQARLGQHDLRSIVLSTDNYHRGKTWLENYKGGEWTDWDAPIVYDLEALQADLQQLYRGESVVNQYFDFASEEPAFNGLIEPTPIILIEGIYARDPSLSRVAGLRYELPTSLATCIGRRLVRDLHERPQFADPEKSLRYMLENAEPAYRAVNAED